MRVNLTTQPIWSTISRPVSNCIAPCRIAFTDPALLRLYAFGFPRFLRIESPAHLNAVGVVDQPVEDAIGQSGIANLFVPARDWQLRSQDRRTHLVAVSIQVRARSPTAIRKTIWKTGRRKPLRDYEKTIGIEPTTEP